MLLNYIKNSKLDLFILFEILSSLNSKSTIFFKLFFNFEDNIFFNSINFNKFFKVIKSLNMLQNLLFSNFNLTLQRYLKFRLY